MNGTRTLTLSVVLAGVVLVFTAFNIADAQQRGRGIQFMGPSGNDGPRSAEASNRFGRGGGAMGEFGMPNPLERLIENAERFDLTEDQIVALEALVGSSEAERDALKSAKETLKDVATADSPNEDAIRLAADGLGDAIGDMVVKMVTIKAQVESILTEDQVAQIKELREKMIERRGGFIERMRSLFMNPDGQ